MTRNQKRKQRIHRVRQWHFRKWDRRFIREAAGNGLTYMKLWHPEERFYSFARCQWLPFPPYKSPTWIAEMADDTIAASFG